MRRKSMIHLVLEHSSCIEWQRLSVMVRLFLNWSDGLNELEPIPQVGIRKAAGTYLGAKGTEKRNIQEGQPGTFSHVITPVSSKPFG